MKLLFKFRDQTDQMDLPWDLIINAFVIWKVLFQWRLDEICPLACITSLSSLLQSLAYFCLSDTQTTSETKWLLSVDSLWPKDWKHIFYKRAENWLEPKVSKWKKPKINPRILSEQHSESSSNRLISWRHEVTWHHGSCSHYSWWERTWRDCFKVFFTLCLRY